MLQFATNAKSFMQSSPNSTNIDLKLKLKYCSTLLPWEETERRTMFLSDWEQYLSFNIGNISFFAADPELSFEMVVMKLETAFRKALMHYDYLAGRLMFSTEGRLEIDCNSAGAGFVVVSSELSLAELGDLVVSSPAFQQLETMRPEKCLFVMQVVSFKCGGFAITACMNHVTFDGWSLKMFLSNLVSLLMTDHLLFTPYNDRHLLSANSFLPHKAPPSDPTCFRVKPKKLESKTFRLSLDNILNLKVKAGKDGGCISKLKVVATHVWRCKELARNNGDDDPMKKSTLRMPVDIRPRLKTPQLPSSYTGVAFLDSVCSITFQELKEKSFSELVEMVSDAVTKITEEEILSVVRSGKWVDGVPFDDVIVTSWMNLGFEDLEYPWGKPKCVCPLVISDWNDVIIMFPNEASKDGANIIVTLPQDEMQKFESMFYKFEEKV